MVQVHKREPGVRQCLAHTGLLQHQPTVAPVPLAFGNDNVGGPQASKGVRCRDHHGWMGVDRRLTRGGLDQVGFEENTFARYVAVGDSQLTQPLAHNSGEVRLVIRCFTDEHTGTKSLLVPVPPSRGAGDAPTDCQCPAQAQQFAPRG